MGWLFNEVRSWLLFIECSNRCVFQWFNKNCSWSKWPSSWLYGEKIKWPVRCRERIHSNRISKGTPKESHPSLTFLELSWRQWQAKGCSRKECLKWRLTNQKNYRCGLREKMDENKTCHHVQTFKQSGTSKFLRSHRNNVELRNKGRDIRE